MAENQDPDPDLDDTGRSLERPVAAAEATRSLSDYADVLSSERRDRLHALADNLEDARILHVNSTASGGGVAELLRSLVPLSNDLGIDTEWAVMDADDAFFEVTKALHNGLQGQDAAITKDMRATFRAVTERNAGLVADEYDLVVLHDPQALGMVDSLARQFPDTRFVWRCHIDLTAASPAHLSFVTDYVDRVDRAVVSQIDYGRGLDVPTTVIHPSIDPLTPKNRPLDDSEAAAERDRLSSIPFDAEAPVVTQVSRFDPWKDQLGVVEAFREVRSSFPDAHLVLAGGMADDDPEGPAIYDRVAEETADDPDVHLLTNEPDETINLLQRESDVVVQKSLREGFGLVVSEALWKETPVVGTGVGGIPLQIKDGENGYLVGPRDTAAVADRLERLLSDTDRRRRFGRRGRKTVREGFLLPRHLADYLALYEDVL
ncbi:glycosyltransferase [Halostella sp. JP-L12]|uniref:glycosyltransferase n=1 Tax=Halostella TaxID=1843185 RepID=UPI000EF810A2|nr:MULTISPECIES: glycosyltransferase [Halostella]NHN46608.1 glycosyltransferase [Halostella sp. JP-L12]